VTVDKAVQAWVSPSFKKKLKAESAMKGMSVVEFTEALGREADSLERQLEKHKKKNGGGFSFGF